MATSRTSYASTATVINTDSVATLGEAAYSFLSSPAIFFHTYMHVPYVSVALSPLGALVMPPPSLSFYWLVWLFPLVQSFPGRAAVLVP